MTVGGGPHAVDDRVVQLAQPGRRQSAGPDLDAAQEPDALVLQDRPQIVLE
jgi:hypothetical protein